VGVDSGGMAGWAHSSDPGSPIYRLTGYDIDRLQVAVEGSVAVAVVDNYVIPVAHRTPAWIVTELTPETGIGAWVRTGVEVGKGKV